MHKGATALLWGEPPGFGGVGGTLPPRLSPGRGKRERGRPSHQSLQLLDSPKSYSPKRVKSAFLLAAHTVHTWPVDPEISQQNRPTSQIPAHSPLKTQLLVRKEQLFGAIQAMIEGGGDQAERVAGAHT